MHDSYFQPLSGKVALITGAAKRLGKVSALALASAGADVAVTFLHSQNEARDMVNELQAALCNTGNSGLEAFREATTQETKLHRRTNRVQALAVRCDVRNPKSVRAAIKTVVQKLGGIDILINNAGTYETVDFEKLTLEQWDKVFAVNARGPFLVSKEALPHLRKRHGRIINLGSLGGARPWPTHAHYCSSKAALHMLTKVMAKALAPAIAVNCVAPGMIELEEQNEFAKRMARQTPMQRNGNAEDVAAAVLFFATAPDFITGQVLSVDGGLGL
jgi:NAD(P)-dependent dehydrogenase (short-subunit alcohol dehydrogenase family)